MPKTDYQNVEEYHQSFSGETLSRLEIIKSIINQVAPDTVAVISYQIPAYKLGAKHYLIYYAAFKNHITISSPWSTALLKHFETELSALKVSKSAIQFPNNKPLPVALIQNIIRFRKAECLSVETKK
ncbi:MAG: DUF1801 domain-containing protein [Bacteroidia bacterium]|nr:DUF1801 domain-containing protein [Bacteroidia bacterium]HQU99589.1 DUF1801 domain-containing protein [Bacteroidia bacterium]